MPVAATENARPIELRFSEVPLSPRDYGLLMLQLVVITVLVWQFHLEEKRHLFAGLVLATVGFAIHAQIPARWRRMCFVGLSMGALVLVLGAVQALYVIGGAVILLTTAAAPLPFAVRAACVTGLIAAGAWLRRNSADGFWPILGSMFMFRMLVYLQTTRRERRPSTLLEIWSYFFLLPNAFFPLFPVVDYSTFRETYYNDERRRIYQTGVHWLATGVLHLMVYRLIKQELLPSPLEIRTATDGAQFLAMNYALYTRISGQFHIICGMLHLFGFHLPRTHDAYFLASSFSDIWRRINIYWKDFMAKSFFYPAFFHARRAGDVPGVIIAVMWVFFWTWIGHSWQAFWLLGDFSLRSQDMLLWLSVGVLMAINGVIDYRRARRPVKTGFTFLGATFHALQVVGMFACISLFWAEWSNPDVLKLLFYSTVVAGIIARDVAIVGGVALLLVVSGVAYQFGTRNRLSPNEQRSTIAALPGRGRLAFEYSVGWHLAPLVAVLLLAQPPVYGLLGAAGAKRIEELQTERASRGEALAKIAGYYEELNDNALQASPFLGDPRTRHSEEVVDFSDMIQRRDDLLDHELIPNWKGNWHGALMTINRWGMRDQDRTLVKPANSTRIALVGSSLVMGYGVNDDETFARLLEERLNADSERNGRHFEVLNFGVGRYSPLHRKLQIEKKVMAFHPDLIVYFAHQDELYTSAGHIGPALSHGLSLNDPCLDSLVQSVGIKPGSSEAMIETIMQRHHVEILKCAYAGIARAASQINARLLYVYLPIPGDHKLPFDPRVCLQLGRDAGFATADLTDWQGDLIPADVMVSSTDHHANALGHRLLADSLEQILLKQLPRSEKTP